MTGASGIARWARAEITSLCAGLGGILDPAVLHDVTDLVDHAEPGIALDLLCDKLLDANAPLDVAKRGRLLTVGRAMGLDDTVAFLVDAPGEQDD
ncbi:MAG: MafI family immunity protein [Microbacterium enclense]